MWCAWRGQRSSWCRCPAAGIERGQAWFSCPRARSHRWFRCWARVLDHTGASLDVAPCWTTPHPRFPMRERERPCLAIGVGASRRLRPARWHSRRAGWPLSRLRRGAEVRGWRRPPVAGRIASTGLADPVCGRGRQIPLPAASAGLDVPSVHLLETHPLRDAVVSRRVLHQPVAGLARQHVAAGALRAMAKGRSWPWPAPGSVGCGRRRPRHAPAAARPHSGRRSVRARRTSGRRRHWRRWRRPGGSGWGLRG